MKSPPKESFWRSLLFVPANNARYVEKAVSSSADAIILDLEDAVLPEHKAAARLQVKEAAHKLKSPDREVFVRINRPLSHALKDIESSICENIDGLVVSKAASRDHLSLLSETVSECEAVQGLETGHTKFIPLIETAEAVSKMESIAGAPRVTAIVCGDEDLAAELECQPDSDTITTIKRELVITAVKLGIRPIGLIGSITEFRDADLYASFVVKSRAAGLKGTFCIHPNQVEIANKGFSPSPNEIVFAQRVVEAAQVAEKAGIGAVALDGKMIDLPVLLRAQKILRSAQLYGNSLT
jgi:citrate lyase subunit beta / citryl-CoA lyase